MVEANLEIYSRSQTRARIGRRRRLNVHASGDGHGGPTVVLAHGLGGRTLEWCRVQPAVAQFAKVISYDRAGFGFSDPGPLPRTAHQNLVDLRAALDAVGATPPYVLVSHSSGNLEMRLFAYTYPEEVAGMVLLDPSGDDQRERGRSIAPTLAVRDDAARERFKIYENLARLGKLVPGLPEYDQAIGAPNPNLPDNVNVALRNWALTPSAWRALYAEDLANSFANHRLLMDARRLLGDMPLIVLTAGPIDWGAGFSAAQRAALNALWITLHEEHASLSTRGVRRDVRPCGHAIHLEQPQVVTAAIQEVIEMGR
jgi:pimeloyl-ACP methyl ester carboxylesterase